MPLLGIVSIIVSQDLPQMVPPVRLRHPSQQMRIATHFKLIMPLRHVRVEILVHLVISQEILPIVML